MTSLAKGFLDAGNTTAAEHCLRQRGAWQALGAVAARSGNLAAAEEMTRRAIAVADSVALRINLADILRQRAMYAHAAHELDRIKTLGVDDDWRYFFRTGQLALDVGKPDVARDAFTTAFRLSEDDETRETCKSGVADALLRLGDFSGFKIWDKEWSRPKTAVWDLGVPEWLGDHSQLEGKRILVHHHQGFGDTIMFARLLRILKFVRADVVAVLPYQLLRLFRTNGISTVDLFDTLPPADFHVPMSLLPSRLDLKFKDLSDMPVPYMRSLDVCDDITLRGEPKIGLVWSADQKNTTGPARSVPLEDLLSLCRIPGAQLYGLQFGGADDITAIGAGSLVHDLSHRICDFAELALLMAQMDVIVSADTAPLHLAGALGLRTIGMLSYAAADWRWLPGHTDSPWYPTMTLVRQRAPDDWPDVVERVRELI